MAVAGLAFRSTNSYGYRQRHKVLGYRPPQRFGPNGYAPRLIVKSRL